MNSRNKLIISLDNIALFSIYAVLFFLPISKAIIESFSYIAIVCFITKNILEKKQFEKSLLNIAVISYTLICFLSIFYSSNPMISSRSFIGKVAQNVLFFFAVAGTLNSEGRIKHGLYVLFFSSTVLGVDGIYQHFTHKDFIRHRPLIFEDRIYASFGTPNDFSSYLVSVIPFALAGFFKGFKRKFVRFLSLALFGLLFTCLLLTVSRGGWFSFLGLLLFMSIWLGPLRALFLPLILFVIFLTAFAPALVKERLLNFFTFLDFSSIDRKMIWSAAWKMIISKPLIGFGLGTFMFNFHNFVSKDYPNTVPYAHNCYLQLASEIGIIGLISFLSILVFFFYDGIKIIKTGKKTFLWLVLLADLSAIIGYCIQMGVDTLLYSVDLGLLLWLLLGIGVAAANCLRNVEAKDRTIVSPPKG